MTLYDVSLTTLTPIHIGDGDDLRLMFEIVTRGKHTYRLDEDALLNAKADLLKSGPDGSYPLPGELLNESDWQNPKFFRYTIPGFPRSNKTYAEVKSFIKDVYDRPYIPGSSLKGALRTALAWNGWNEVKPKLNRNELGRHRNWAGQKLERNIFGRNPNYDLLRTLQVSDCNGPKEPGEGLVLVNAQVLTKRSHGSPIEMEAMRGDVCFTGTIKIDDPLFEMPEAEKLGFANRRHWLDELTARVQNHSRARIQKLITWFEDADECTQIAQFYQKLYNSALQPYQALMQLGWGSGWDGKTFGTHLQEDINLFEKIVEDFGLHKHQIGSPPRQPGDPFPRSKRAVMKVKGNDAIAFAPFGWVLFEMKVHE